MDNDLLWITKLITTHDKFSEDIDLVQIKPGPIKPIMERLDEVITFFEEDRRTQNRGHGIKALYRFTSEYEEIRLRLKLEINCKEHFNILDWVDFPFEVKSDWFSGQAQIRTYSLSELLGTKLRALYQRSKGRDCDVVAKMPGSGRALHCEQ